MSDKVTIVTLILAAIPATIASVLAAIMTILVFQKSAKIEIVAKTTHELVNGSMLFQLKLHARTARILANLMPSIENVEAADLAERILTDHKSKLRLVDKDDFPA